MTAPHSSGILGNILAKISERNPRHSKKLGETLSGLEPEFYLRAEAFFEKYTRYAEGQGKSLEFGIDSYLRMVADTLFEHMRFAESGEYTCKSFADAYERVYSNPAVMEYYMHGLMMSQFLWKHHYDILRFFTGTLPAYKPEIKAYLEVGGGHGLYLSEAVEILGEGSRYELVDISSSSVEMARSFVDKGNVKFHLQDIYEYQADGEFDFITMGEVMEHVEDPVSLLKQLHRLLRDGGSAFVSTPANAPAIDHIYLFRNVDHIRETIRAAGFEVTGDITLYTENVTKEVAEEKRIATMYGAFIKKV